MFKGTEVETLQYCIQSQPTTKVSHHVDDHFAQRLSLFFAEVLEDVTVVLLQKLEAYSQMVILQH